MGEQIRREKEAETYRGWTTVMVEMMPCVVISLASRLGDVKSIDLTVVCVWPDQGKEGAPAGMGVLLTHYPLYILTLLKKTIY